MEKYWSVVQSIVEGRGRKLVRYSFFEKLWESLEGGSRLTVLRAPTGAGKTEAVFAPFAYALRSPPSPWFSLVYALPTRSLVYSMAKRLSKAVAASGAGLATVTGNYGDLLAPSPFLEGDVAVSTYDTLLYAFYGSAVPGYHVLLPASKLSGSLVVLDEVQLLQDVHWYGPSLLPHHVESLLRFGADVILMSATIPSVLLEEVRETAKALANVDACVIDAKDRPQRGRLRVELRRGPLPGGEELVRLLRERGDDAYPALIVVNTVGKAVQVYLELLRSGLGAQPLLLHSRIRSGIRRRVEGLFEGDAGGSLPHRAVIVATQVVEAGLDLDVRLLVTELSPIDSLIQRLGRCARKSDGYAIVYTDPGGGVHVYPSELLEKTRELIQGRERELERSVLDLGVAQALVDGVYTKQAVDMLRDRVRHLLDGVRNIVSKRYPALLFSWDVREDIKGSHLLRLGFEVLCLYLTGEKYEALVSGGVRERALPRHEAVEAMGGRSVRLKAEELADNIVRISVTRHDRPPSCLVHSANGSEFVVELKLREAAGGEVELIPRKLPASGKVALRAPGTLYLLNPSFYEVDPSSGQELGVVKP